VGLLAIDSMLTGRGHKVVRVTLTGLASATICIAQRGLDTQSDDVVNKILWATCTTWCSWDQLRRMVITGVHGRDP